MTGMAFICRAEVEKLNCSTVYDMGVFEDDGRKVFLSKQYHF